MREDEAPWTPYAWFPWVEWRRAYVCGIDPACPGGELKTERRWRKKITAPKIPLKYSDVLEIERAIDRSFNWLRDYGPLWEPESTAFWLAPTTPDELASWCAKYRYGEDGLFTADNPIYGDVTIRVTLNAVNTKRRTVNTDPYGNPYQQAMLGSYIEQLQNLQNRNPHYSNPLGGIYGLFGQRR